MDIYKKWLLEFFGIVIVAYLAIACIIDPFGVFGDRLFNTPEISMIITQRFNKIEYLDKHFRKYNSYLIGGSRIAAIKPEWVEKYMPGTRFYNLFVSAATEYDNLNHVKYIVENYIVKNIILQVHINDLYSYFGSDDTTLMTEPHYKVSGKNVMEFYFSYMNPGAELLIKKLKYVFGIEKIENLKTVVEETGERSYRYEEKLIAQDHEKYIRKKKTFHLRDEASKLKTLMGVTRTASYKSLFAQDRKAKGIRMKESIESLKKIKQICDRNHVNLILLTVPHHHMMLDVFDMEDYLTFLKQLSDISPFWDFSGYNSITTDNRNYYEWSHYRVTIVKYILARIFNDPLTEVPEDFGVLVTKESIKDHLIKLRKNILAHRENEP
ncbi:hypothetical protein [Desulfonema magnum]|uniref:Uncharacterized protein n=1 Tax=Desulfonema magnum TaxID=45655 RepID=A0A975BYT4_9BACT|nr:hypothetical protein [Desulfonema magnum]QTA93902.1 Uncharacterized protein dnm_100100 [Desulfonema magnum]